jgi:hypothetical protein
MLPPVICIALLVAADVIDSSGANMCLSTQNSATVMMENGATPRF